MPSAEWVTLVHYWASNYAYMRKIVKAGSFKQYERNHLTAITATFVPKFPRLPPEMVRHVVEYAFHVGDY